MNKRGCVGCISPQSRPLSKGLGAGSVFVRRSWEAQVKEWGERDKEGREVDERCISQWLTTVGTWAAILLGALGRTV